ncbi:DUF423 domain-containing protein [Confluentibacter lentus]|uniref:DUF423 domain-containing protein n=1 Tax=Confluentibacter lentus TaxID=1699412 RepID=UPI000C281788|nr:DUF423 domain-containing protein [Confluentibacter lentus]
MNKKILITASILGIISIILGAFGAHALKALISSEMQQTFETGVRYQMYHALFLLFVGTTALISEKAKKIIYYLVVLGIVLFSGSIYGLATNDLTGFDFKSIGFITPIGGLCFIVSWGILIINLMKAKSNY